MPGGISERTAILTWNLNFELDWDLELSVINFAKSSILDNWQDSKYSSEV